jgi:hypothetical protein
MDDANDGHYHEALDRAYCINTMIEELLAEHPAIEDSPGELGVALRRFQDAGQQLYQLISHVRHSKFA